MLLVLHPLVTSRGVKIVCFFSRRSYEKDAKNDGERERERKKKRREETPRGTRNNDVVTIAVVNIVIA